MVVGRDPRPKGPPAGAVSGRPSRYPRARMETTAPAPKHPLFARVAAACLVVLTTAGQAGFVLVAVWAICGRSVPRNDSRFTSEDYALAMAELREARTPQLRYYALADAAKTTVYFGGLDDADAYARELLDLAERRPRCWNRGNALHDGHLVLGLVALRRGDVETAKAELLLAGDTPGSPQLDSFGPNMCLARELLKRGERDAVIAYFERIRGFWTSERGRLDAWASDVKAGRMPDFGAYLVD